MAGKTDMTKKILLVEDEAVTAVLQKKILTNNGYEVILSASGEAAVTTASEDGSIDLILMDIDLGEGIDGTEAAEQILKERDIPLVFLSSHTEPDIVNKTEKITSYGYVVKNTGVTVLLASIKMAFRLFEAKKIQKQKENEYRLLFENASSGIFISQDGILKIVNPASERIIGYPAEELSSKPFTKFMHPDDVPMVLDRYFRRLKGEAVETGYIFRIITSSGEIKWIEITSALIEWQGSPATLNYIIDITDRKKAEDALRQNDARVRQKLEALLSPSGDLGALELEDIIDIPALQVLMDDFYALTGFGIGIVDIKGKVLVSTGWQDICLKFHRNHPETCRNCVESDTLLSSGIDPGEFKLYKCKNNMWDIATPIIVGGTHAGNLFLGQFLFRDEEPDYAVFRAQAKRYGFDEKEYIESLERVPRWDRETINRVISFYSKLAGQVAMLSYSRLRLARTLEDSRRASESLNQTSGLLKIITENMHDLVAMTDLAGNYIFIGRSHDILGYDLNSLIGKNVIDYVHPDDLPFVQNKFTEGIKKNTKSSAEYRYRRADGTYLWFETVGSVLRDENGLAMNLIFSTRNITERKASEDKVRLELSEKELLIKEAHHRIKNNISAIGSLLSMSTNSITDQSALSVINAAVSRIQSMSLLYDRLLLNGDIKSVPVRGYLNDVIDSSMKLFAGILNVKTDRQIENFNLDSKRIFLIGIITNELMTNALKYAFNNAGTGEIQISFSVHNGRAELIVHDNGRGLPEKTTGFGLTLVNMLARQLEGVFTAENENGAKCVLNFKI